MPTRIAIRYLDGSDKIELLSKVLGVAGFETALEKAMKASGKTRERFKVVIKPNASMYIRRDEDGVTTDAVLVLSLVERLLAQGFGDVTLVESSNLYQSGFENRNPVTVMAALGLAGGVTRFVPAAPELEAYVLLSDGRRLPYRLADLAADTVMIDAPGMPHGKLKVGRDWLEADFRVSFAKFKTHIYDGYTLLVKNTYGCLPEGDKMYHYHKMTGAALPTIEQLKICPVHFGIIDGVTGADGLVGVKWDRAIPRTPAFIMAGENIGEVERAACRVMGVSIKRAEMSRRAIDILAEPAELDGEVRALKPWGNVPGIVPPVVRVLERFYLPHRFLQMVSDFLGSPPFKRKKIGLVFTALSFITILPALLYASAKRHWVLRKWREISRRRRAGVSGIPRAMIALLDRLDAPELGVVAEALRSDPPAEVTVFGHRVLIKGAVRELPNSTSFKLFRIPEVLALASTPGLQTALAEAVGKLVALET